MKVLILLQVLFKDGIFQWKRLENLIVLAKENVAKMSRLRGKDMYVSHCRLDFFAYIAIMVHEHDWGDPVFTGKGQETGKLRGNSTLQIPSRMELAFSSLMRGFGDSSSLL